MSLEKRLAEALHQTDDFRPSVDLFARLNRSIEQDLAHRRRVRTGVALAVLGVGLLLAFLGTTAIRDSNGAFHWPKWSVQTAMAAIQLAVLLALGPAIRRLGQPYLGEVFHLSPETSERFSRLLDIAYYVFFGGGILSSLDLTRYSSIAMGREFRQAISQIALLLLLLGVAHVGNLLLLPMLGLLFTSVTRRERRLRAGTAAPPISERAERVDRWVTAAGIGVVLIGLILVFTMIVIGVSSW